MSAAHKPEIKISEEEYLAGELISDVKYEYIDGIVYAMAGASESHGLISGNIFSEIKTHLKQNKSSCDVFISDMKVRISRNITSYFYPDVVVICDQHEEDSDYYKHSPTIIVEVLSKTTRKNDKSIKKLAYFNISGLQEYVIIEQDYCEIEVFRRNKDWQASLYFIGDEITFDSIGSTISVEDIYYHVNNDDMSQFLREKEDS